MSSPANSKVDFSDDSIDHCYEVSRRVYESVKRSYTGTKFWHEFLMEGTRYYLGNCAWENQCAPFADGETDDEICIIMSQVLNEE